jgi:hypothetical protein
VIVSVPPAPVLANCSGVFRLPGGTIAFQTTAVPGPTAKQLAVTGGTGTYNNAGGDGTLVEFGNGKGKLARHLLSLVCPRRGSLTRDTSGCQSSLTRHITRLGHQLRS